MISVPAPPTEKARRNPRTPSPAASLPIPVSHAESTAHSTLERSSEPTSSAVRIPSSPSSGLWSCPRWLAPHPARRVLARARQAEAEGVITFDVPADRLPHGRYPCRVTAPDGSVLYMATMELL